MTRLLLAALVIALAMNALAPFLQVRETKAQGSIPLTLLNLTCEGVLPKQGATLKLDCSGATL
jgi:hypothetical protein